MPPASPDQINDALRSHAVEAEEWPWRTHVRFLHEWAERFNSEFQLAIPTPAIQLDAIERRALGRYRHGRNGFGLRHEIALNTSYLARPVAEVLEVLLHELLHEWQELHGKPGKNNYHNKAFRERARSFGLIVDNWGHSLGVVPGLFTALLEQFGVDAVSLPVPKDPPQMLKPSGEAKQKKWSCSCTNVWAATRVDAVCRLCGERFEKGLSNRHRRVRF